METDQKEINEEKIEDFIRLAKNFAVSRPATLLHTGDDWCWLQYYALRFLGRDTYVFVKEEDREKIKFQDLPKNVEIVYFKDDKEYEKLAIEKVEEYAKILDKCYGGADE